MTIKILTSFPFFFYLLQLRASSCDKLCNSYDHYSQSHQNKPINCIFHTFLSLLFITRITGRKNIIHSRKNKRNSSYRTNKHTRPQDNILQKEHYRSSFSFCPSFTDPQRVINRQSTTNTSHTFCIDRNSHFTVSSFLSCFFFFSLLFFSKRFSSCLSIRSRSSSVLFPMIRWSTPHT